MEPRKLEWENNGGVQNVVLRNNTGERRAIKIKCSDTQRYRVNPVYAFVESGKHTVANGIRSCFLAQARLSKWTLLVSRASPRPIN